MTPRAAAKTESVESIVENGFRAMLEQMKGGAVPPLEEFITSPEWCNFGDASPVQRALMRAADGLQPGLSTEQLKYHFGAYDFVNPCKPKVIVIRCGVRAAKSLIAACGCVRNALDADCSVCRPGELIKALITAPLQRQTRGTLAHVTGATTSSQRLKAMVDGTPNKEDMRIRRKRDGRVVEIAIVAAAADGSTLRSTWVASAIISEADFFDDEEGAVNLPAQVTALRPRMLPGGQIWIESSPVADEGPFNKLVVDYFGKPRDGVLVFHSDSFSMFPGLDREGERQLRASDPDEADREYMAIPLSTSGKEFFPIAAVRACVRQDRPLHLAPVECMPHWGGVDMGFRKNSSAVALARSVGGKTVLAYHEELRPEPGRPLSPSSVCELFANRALSYWCFSLRGDKHYELTSIEEMAKHRDRFNNTVSYQAFSPTTATNTEMFSEFRRRMLEGTLELPNDPVLISQIEKTKSRPLAGGAIQIVLPKKGHTHGDLLSAVVHACVQVPADVARVTGDDWGATVNDSRWAGMGRGF